MVCSNSFSKPLLGLLAASGFLQSALAAPSNRLAACATAALRGDDAADRVKLPADEAWEDVRVGAMVLVRSID